MKTKINAMLGLTVGLLTNFVMATEFHGNRIHAFVDVDPALEPKVMKILTMIEMGLTKEELYQQFEQNKHFTCLRIEQNEVTPIIRNATFKFEVYSDKLGNSVTASTSGNQITINENFKQSDLNWTNTLFHEMLHVISFGHCGKNNPRIYRKILKSVPYQGGNYMENVLNQLGGEL